VRLPLDGCSVCRECNEWFPTFFLNCRFCGGPLHDVQYVPPPRPGEQGRWIWYAPGELSPAARYGLYTGRERKPQEAKLNVARDDIRSSRDTALDSEPPRRHDPIPKIRSLTTSETRATRPRADKPIVEVRRRRAKAS